MKIKIDRKFEISEKEFIKANLKKEDKVTFKDGTKGVVLSDIVRDEDIENIVKIERPTSYTIIFKREERILDDVERRYLKNVIRPFHNRIKTIVKKELVFGNKEYIRIIFKNIGYVWDLPIFDKNTMYKNMKLDKEYSLEKLRI